jgi:hypothetical protein
MTIGSNPMRSALFSLLMWCLLTSGVGAAAADEAVVGEFSIPSVIPLTGEQREALRELVEHDPEAAALADQAREHAEPALDDEPRPIEVIHYEGLVNTNPKRIETVAHLRDMTKIAWLLRHWQATGDERAAEALRRLTIAWTRTYRLTGNDVNENKFFPMLVAYLALRDTFDDAPRESIDRWVRELGELHRRAVAESDHLTNRYGKHVRLLAIAGMILDERAWIDEARAGVKRFVTHSLFADGTSLDLKRRDTLTYHASSLKKPLDLAIMLGPAGRDLYGWTSPDGGSLQRSVEYVVPYAMGRKQRREWENSQIDLDRRRAEAGLEKYRRGRLYDPQDAQSLMEKASYFDPELMRVVHHLTEDAAERFPTWQTLINQVKGKDATTPNDQADRP